MDFRPTKNRDADPAKAKMLQNFCIGREIGDALLKRRQQEMLAEAAARKKAGICLPGVSTSVSTLRTRS